MTATQQVVGMPTSHESYQRNGWAVVAIPPKTKGPTHTGWNTKEGCLAAGATLPSEWGVGLCHAYSGTMALDIDEWEHANAYFLQRGIDLAQLFQAPDAVAIDSGNPGHGKLIFSMPFGIAMPSKKITYDGKHAMFELRCGTKDGLTVQDVLPPSRHPTGTTYRWAGAGNWQRPPQLPMPILELWQQLIEQDSQRNIPNGQTTEASWDEITSALNAISPDCDRKTWIEVGMALHSINHQDGFDAWNTWSSKSEKYKSGEMNSQWKSFKPNPNGIGPSSLFHHAYQAGWKRPAPDISELFRNVKSTPQEVLKKIRTEIPAPQVDLSLWPPILADRAREVATEVGCDPLVPLMAGLAAVAAAADKQIRLKITASWSVPPLLWLMTVGAPADKKTPGSKPMFVPLRQLEIEDRDRYQTEMHFWKGQEAKFAGQSKAYREWCASAESGMPGAIPPQVDPLPPEPISLRLIVNDATSQKVVHMAAGRPRGFLLLLDEMNNWLKKITDPRGGEDRGCWIQGYESASYTMDRVGSGSITASNLAVPVYGNCQPDVFKHYMNAASNDGLVQRFIPVVLNADHTGMWQESVPEFLSCSPNYEAMIRQVYIMPEYEYDCSPEAIAEFRLFSQWYLKGRHLDAVLKASPIYMTAVGKIEGTCARLAILLHLMKEPFNPTVTVETMRQATAIMRQFIVPSLRYAFMEIVGLKDELATWITEHIIQVASVRPTVTLSEIRRAARRQITDRPSWQADQDIRMIMDELCEVGYATLFVDHPRHVAWTINPALADLFGDYRKSIITAKQQIIDHFKAEAVSRTGKVSDRHFDAIGHGEQS